MRLARVEFVVINICIVDIIVNDVYAAPLCGLSWDDDPDSPTTDVTPRIKDRPMSVVARGIQTRSLPQVPHLYDVPPPESPSTKVNTKKEQAAKAQNYYNTQNLGKFSAHFMC